MKMRNEKLINVVKDYNEIFRNNLMWGDSVTGAENIFGDMIPNDAVVLLMPQSKFKTFAMLELKLGFMAMNNDIAGLTVPLIAADKTTFPLVIIIDKGTTNAMKGNLVHELTHTRQLNTMGLEEFTAKAHSFMVYLYPIYSISLKEKLIGINLNTILKMVDKIGEQYALLIFFSF